MTRQLLICIICFCCFGGYAFGGLKIHVHKESKPVAAAEVVVYQRLNEDGTFVKELFSGKTGEDGGPYEPKLEPPRATLSIKAEKHDMSGGNIVFYEGSGETPIDVIVSLDKRDYTLRFPRQSSTGGHWFLKKNVRYVPECSIQCCVDAEGNSYPVTREIYQPVIKYVWVLLPPGKARLTLSVPADAEVFINDGPTKSTGARRVYLSKGLADGVNYWYRVRVRIVRDGKVYETIREVVLRVGDNKSVSVDFSGRNISHQTDARPQRDNQRSR